MNLLFTGVGRRVELLQAFKTAATVLEKPTRIYGVDIDETAPALEFCDCVRKVPEMTDSGYIPQLLRICEKEQIDCLIPTIDTDLLALAEYKAKFQAIGTMVLVSNPDVIHLCRDKMKTAELFKKSDLNFPAPAEDWKAYKGPYPAFIKPRDGSGSIDSFKVSNEEELVFYAARIPNYLVQPFIAGKEYTVDAFCDWDGNVISIVPRERLQIRAGEVLKTRICMDEQIIEECNRICTEIKPCGPLTIQLIRDEVGNDWYIEVNPRFGGGVPLSMKAGARSAEAIIRMLDGEYAGDYEVEDSAVYSRFDQSVCINKGITQIRGVIFDLDDTLYSEKEYVRSGFKVVSNYLGGGYEERLWNYFEDRKPAIDELLKELKRGDEKDAVVGIYRNHKPSIHLYDGVAEMIAELKGRGVKVGIITDGRPEGQKNKLEALGLEVDDVIITDELGGIQFRKPCDIAFRIMTTRWKMYPADIVYVGDNPSKDFLAPRQLGIKTIYFQNTDGLHKAKTEESMVACIPDLRNKLLNCGK